MKSLLLALMLGLCAFPAFAQTTETTDRGTMQTECTAEGVKQGVATQAAVAVCDCTVKTVAWIYHDNPMAEFIVAKYDPVIGQAFQFCYQKYQENPQQFLQVFGELQASE